MIKSLKLGEGSISSDQRMIATHVASFYESFHKSVPLSLHSHHLSCIPKEVDEVDLLGLEAIPSIGEIKSAVWDLDPLNSPSLDGFPGEFFTQCRSIIEANFCDAVRSFFIYGHLPYGVNNSFITHIPKIDAALSLDKFHPICMGNFFVKTISKIIALHISLLLPRLIFDEQGAFQKGKIITSNISLASELANIMHSSVRGSGLGLKLDIQKAYDTLSWPFLFVVLKQFGFSNKCIAWVNQILASSKTQWTLMVVI
ncbi:uncharacterized protein LOC122638740 [Telopea speciosissima]|uniref:uncharacterized protein LOC122638740 n=1 Tax=Telopea speciosissima TaxID=54955 RepID=UPI001CC59A0A|nr:uncharacterized protein LOC122638740 [Telopea speciosissima]